MSPRARWPSPGRTPRASASTWSSCTETCWRAVAGRRFDAILSNPPYITQDDLPAADPEVREFEPQLATVAGPDGREIYQRLLGPARDLLEPEGVVVVECGEGQAPWIAAELRTPRIP